MNAVTPQLTAVGQVRCSICRRPREIVVVDHACGLAACGDCGFTLAAAEILIELANRRHAARLRSPISTDNFNPENNH